MKTYLSTGFVLLLSLLMGCGQPQDPRYNLTAADFAIKIKELPGTPVIDVRTSEEFSGGHLVNAKNINWEGGDFEKQISALDKAKPVFVYCLKGGRSTDAAKKMRAEGFVTVYQLKGGFTAWKAAGLPETTDNALK